MISDPRREMNYRVTLAYDGTGYLGWQMQAGGRTIQGELEAALARLNGGPVVAHGAGRTDAGVHALGQVVSFRLARRWEGMALRRALNGNLPPEIRVLEAMPADDEFHARFSARGKVYRYEIDTNQVADPLRARYAWHYPYELDLARLAAEGRALLGTHDFSAFTVAGGETRTRVRTLTEARAEREEGLVRLWFAGDGFLKYMVRTMVAAIVESSRGRLKVGSVEALLSGRDRAAGGTPAPAKGLTLIKVEY